MITSQQDLIAALGIELSNEQWQAIGAELEPAVMVAGAGSGKTTSMAARVAWLVGSGRVLPDRVLGLTFTNKATGELLEQVRDSLHRVGVSSDTEPVIQTYNAFAGRIVTEHGIRIGREPRGSVLTDAGRASLAYQLVCRTQLPLDIFETSPAEITRKLLLLDAGLVEVDISTDEIRAFDRTLAGSLAEHQGLTADVRSVQETAERRLVLADLVDEWRSLKADRDVLDFSDQIRLALQIVEAYPAVADDVRERFDVVLLDEYQDTSIAQRHLLAALFGSGHPITAVGDPCQAIYGWRGASVANIENFPTHFRGEGETSRYPLSVNRRSGSRILDVANVIATDLRAVHASIQELQAWEERGEGEVRCGLFATETDEVAWLVDDVLQRGGPGRWSDIAILASTRKALAGVDQLLREAGIPTQRADAAQLLEQPVVVELLAMLRVVQDPTANASLIRVLTNARWVIGPRDLAQLGHRARELAGFADNRDATSLDELLNGAVAGTEPVEAISLSEALADPGDPAGYAPAALARFADVVRQIELLRAHASEPIPELIMRTRDLTGIGIELELGSDTRVIEERRRALRSLMSLTAELQQDGRISLGAFLSYLDEVQRTDTDIKIERVSSDDAVHLITLHKAKGLQFPHVYLPFVSKEAFPGGKKRGSWLTGSSEVPWPIREDCPPDLAHVFPAHEPPGNSHVKAYKAHLSEVERLDEHRLAYVAMTRAQESLTVTGSWWGREQKRKRGPHPFLTAVYEVTGGESAVTWVPQEEVGNENPALESGATAVPWPVPNERLAHVQSDVAALRSAEMPAVLSERAQRWQRVGDVLLAEERLARSSERVVQLPDAVSASTWIRAQTHPAEVAAALARPMPTEPSRAAHRGTVVHSWIESRLGQQTLLDPFDLPGAADDDITTDEAIEALQAAFEASPFADRAPVATERAFAVLINGRVVRGRIDAVFRDGDSYQVVDWKTGRHHDPMQLAIYRAAWAQIAGVPVEQVDAAFFVIGPNELVIPSDLPDLQVDRPLAH